MRHVVEVRPDKNNESLWQKINKRRRKYGKRTKNARLFLGKVPMSVGVFNKIAQDKRKETVAIMFGRKKRNLASVVTVN